MELMLKHHPNHLKPGIGQLIDQRFQFVACCHGRSPRREACYQAEVKNSIESALSSYSALE
jgi:hypothetical protein